MAMRRFLAFDLGASSGRVVVGTLADGTLSLEEIHRFRNTPVEVRGTVYWDVLALYRNVLTGMRKYSRRFGKSVDGIGIDSWALDFGLLASDGTLLANPVHYRDRRTEGMPEYIAQRISPQELFRRTGVSPASVHTLCHMVSLQLRQSSVLECTTAFLMMPDLLAYFLTGQKRCERTQAITTQLYDPRRKTWHKEVLDAFDLPMSAMPNLVDPGTCLGELCESAKRETGLTEAVVIVPCTHDTASAVAAVPGKGEDWAFLSSGTWSVLGALADTIVTSEQALAASFVNELTLGSFFLCRNIIGLWLLQQARSAWRRRGEAYSYSELVTLAEQAPEGGPLIHPNDRAFLAPEDMCGAIADYCRKTGQSQPKGPGETTRCILESLAFCYRYTLRQLQSVLDRRFRILHIVGGGSLNTLLCQWTADATGIPVLAGPAEASATGNVLVQALARGCLKSPQDIRDTVRDSSTLLEYEPRDTARWEERSREYTQLAEYGKA